MYKLNCLQKSLFMSLFVGLPALAQNVEIGLVAPLSGPAATYGKDILNGVDLAVEEINAGGGMFQVLRFFFSRKSVMPCWASADSMAKLASARSSRKPASRGP